MTADRDRLAQIRRQWNDSQGDVADEDITWLLGLVDAAHQEAAALRVENAATVEMLREVIAAHHEWHSMGDSAQPKSWELCDRGVCLTVKGFLANLAPATAQAVARQRAMEERITELTTNLRRTAEHLHSLDVCANAGISFEDCTLWSCKRIRAALAPADEIKE